MQARTSLQSRLLPKLAFLPTSAQMEQSHQVPKYVIQRQCSMPINPLQAGIVIASPNKVNPDYLYTWVRDSSLVFKVITDQFTHGEDNSLRGLIEDFFVAEAVLQQVTNPSGTIATGGLGEPKFNIDGSAFTGSWGRPQRGLSIP